MPIRSARRPASSARRTWGSTASRIGPQQGPVRLMRRIFSVYLARKPDLGTGLDWRSSHRIRIGPAVMRAGSGNGIPGGCRGCTTVYAAAGGRLWNRSKRLAAVAFGHGEVQRPSQCILSGSFFCGGWRRGSAENQRPWRQRHPREPIWDKVGRCRHHRFPHPGPLPVGEGDKERATRNFHRKTGVRYGSAGPSAPLRPPWSLHGKYLRRVSTARTRPLAHS
jgi:hypothetical protein